jgi:hypothetical protein
MGVCGILNWKHDASFSLCIPQCIGFFFYYTYMNMATTEKTFDDHWGQIEKKFSFGNVYKAMKALDWLWSFDDDRKGIPSEQTIKMKAFDLCKRAYETRSTIGSGGLWAAFQDGMMTLAFSIEYEDTEYFD